MVMDAPRLLSVIGSSTGEVNELEPTQFRIRTFMKYLFTNFRDFIFARNRHVCLSEHATNTFKRFSRSPMHLKLGKNKEKRLACSVVAIYLSGTVIINKFKQNCSLI